MRPSATFVHPAATALHPYPRTEKASCTWTHPARSFLGCWLIQYLPLPDRVIGRGEVERTMETVEEDVEEYSWREVVLPHLVPVVPDAPPELERETGERRRGRDILVAVDFGPNSKHAFDWALAHFARLADTVHLVHAVSSVHNEIVYEKSRELMEDLAVEAFKTLLVRTRARIVEGDAGKIICREAERLKPAAVIVGTRGRSLIQSVLQGSVSEYCFHNCKAAPIIIVPGKEAGEHSVL